MASDVTVAPAVADTSIAPVSTIDAWALAIARPPRSGVSSAPSIAASTTTPLAVSTVSVTEISPPKPWADAVTVTVPGACSASAGIAGATAAAAPTAAQAAPATNPRRDKAVFSMSLSFADVPSIGLSLRDAPLQATVGTSVCKTERAAIYSRSRGVLACADKSRMKPGASLPMRST